MIAVRPAAARGSTVADRSRTRHSFSCADYYDPAHMGFGPLRAINELSLDAGAAVPAGMRANIDVLTWVISGSVTRSGRDTPIRAGELDVLCAGRGAIDDLANASASLPARVLQVWMQSERLNAAPARSSARFDDEDGVRLIAGGPGSAGVAVVRADTRLWLVRLRAGRQVTRPLCLGRRAWLQVTVGSVRANGAMLDAGSGAATMHETGIELVALEDAELLLFDLPAF